LEPGAFGKKGMISSLMEGFLASPPGRLLSRKKF
jgi:hypothetical protein